MTFAKPVLLLVEEQGQLEINLVQRNTCVKIRKLEISFALTCHWTRGNLPLRETW